MQLLVYLLAYFSSSTAFEYDDTVQELSDGHLKYFKTNSKERYCERKKNKNDERCIQYSFDSRRYCWGYEKHCLPNIHYTYPKCSNHDSRWAKNIEGQEKLFWEQADFGYIKKKLDTLQYVCKPKDKTKNKSFLKCNENWEYCQGKNIYLDFSKKTFKDNNRFNHELLATGEIGGYCYTNEQLKSKELQLKRELNSWKGDLERFTSLDEDPIPNKCDVIINDPVVFMKLDSGANLYHHFCDYFNLYASQHINGSFSKDIHIYNWDTSNHRYGDLFGDSWQAFTSHPLKYIKDFAGKKVCLKDVVFSLPPRMIYGLYYNTPLCRSCRCHGTSLFGAFSEHFIHRLNITQHSYENDVVRVTLLTRSTKYRRILNQENLIAAMKRKSSIRVTAVDYNRNLPFLKQVEMSHNTDILIGMHGAGLTHMLFQPDWGAVFELYNAGDPACYHDLARLRGLEYFTWNKKDKLFPEDEGHHPTLGAHEKFTNYSFDESEFMNIVEEAVDYVRKKRPLSE